MKCINIACYTLNNLYRAAASYILLDNIVYIYGKLCYELFSNTAIYYMLDTHWTMTITNPE